MGRRLTGKRGWWSFRLKRMIRKSRRGKGRRQLSSSEGISSSSCGFCSYSPLSRHCLLGRCLPPAEFENVYSVSVGRIQGGEGWRDGLVEKLNYESNVSCSMEASDAVPIDCARAGIGTRCLVAMKVACKHGHPAGKAFSPFGPA